MTAKILDGQAIAQGLRERLRQRVERLRAAGVVPGLGVLLVGDDPASLSYVTAKEKACAALGLYSQQMRLPATASLDDIRAVIASLNAAASIHGVLVQMPLPASGMEPEVVMAIDPDKDVDGFHPLNVGRLALGMPTLWPCTPHGILQIFKSESIPVSGRHVVIVGRSRLVGQPLAMLLARKHEPGNATVTLCHTGTPDLGRFTRQADILVAAAGRPGLVTADMVRPGAVVIDVGVTRVPDPDHARGFRLVGDVDYAAVCEKAAAITPVPNGVGPLTITMLMHNTIQAAEWRLARTGRRPG